MTNLAVEEEEKDKKHQALEKYEAVIEYILNSIKSNFDFILD